MILITDIGKDIDDAVALTYGIIAGLPIKTVITTSKNAAEAAKICQNIIKELAEKYPAAQNIKVYQGSTKPIRGGLNHGTIYKGPFSKGDFVPDKFEPLKVPRGDVVAIGPLTDLAALMEHNRAKRVMFMAQCRKDGSSLAADMEAYNLRCDPFASEMVFQFQDKVPFGFITKVIAYRVPFTKTDFNEIGSIDHPVAKFLKDHAFKTFDHFKESVPELYERIYKGTDNLSYCYDPLTMLAAAHPDLFTFEKFGPHRIAVDIQPEQAKKTLMDTLKNGLS